MGRRKYSAEFKTKIVLELLREEKQLGELAAEHELRWKSQVIVIYRHTIIFGLFPC